MNRVSAQLGLHLRAREALLAIVTAEETRALALVSEAARAAGRAVMGWSQHRGLGPVGARRWDVTVSSAMAVLEAMRTYQGPAVFALLDFQPWLRDPAVTRGLKDTVYALEGSERSIVIVGADAAWPIELRGLVTEIEAGWPDREELRDVLAEAMGDVVGDADARTSCESLLDAAAGLTLREFSSALAREVADRGSIGPGALETVRATKNAVAHRAGVVYVEPTERGLDGIGGLDVLKRWIAVRGRGFSTAAHEAGLPTPRGVMLVGAQGAGKSLCARTIAAEWKMPLIRLDPGRVFSSLVGSSEANMRTALTLAERIAPCVLWIDEVDKGFGGAGGSAADAGTASRVFGTFVTWLQEHRASVFTVATANDAEYLPPELMRRGRFDEVFFVDLPGVQERAEIVAIHLERRVQRVEGFDVNALAEASDGFSGAELEQAVIAAMYTAFDLGRAMETWDVQRAIRDTVSLGRSSPERLEALRAWGRARARAASTRVGPVRSRSTA